MDASLMRWLSPLAVLVSFVLPASGQTRGVVPEDYYREVGVGEVSVAPHGSLVAFTVTTIVEDENRRHREVWVQRLAAGQPEGDPLRLSDPTAESSGPSWAPASSVLAFTSRRGEDENPTWFLRVTAPGGEAFHVDGVRGTPHWSRDGDWIAYLREVGEEADDEEADEEREGWIASNAVTRTLDRERFDGRVVTTMRYKRDGTLELLPDPAVRDKPQLFIVPAEGGRARQRTELDVEVRDPVWSSSGDAVYFTADPAEDDEDSDDLTSDLYRVGRDSGEPLRLTTNPGSERAPAVSPDGRRLAFLSTAARGEETDIMVVALGADGRFDGTPRNITVDWDLTPDAPSWTADGRALRFLAGVGGNVHLFEVPAEGGAVARVTTGDRQLASVSASADGQVLAYTATDVVTPAEVYVAGADGASEARVTSFNDAWLADVTRMPAERLTWRVADGTEIEGWVIKPVGYQPGRRYPMVLKIHGGPHSAYGNTYFRTFHVLSNAGFFVLYANPRGSSHYGHAFMYATRGKWGELDSEDVLAGVDAALARYPEIDPARLGVSGGSYGGYMTNWLTATTDRFAAAVTSRSIANWESWYGSTDVQALTEFEFFGPPWEARERYRRLSPMTYVEHVTAPTLVIHGENDYRTPIGDGEQWFMALRKQGVPTELVRYPRSSHGLSRTGEPWLLVDRLERIRSWFEHWLGKDTGDEG